MKPEAAAFLSAAEKDLIQARGILAIEFPDQAARLAYYAQFHAAPALIFERMSRIAKTHKGVRRLFHQLAGQEADLDPSFAGELTHAYLFKQYADYETGIPDQVTGVQAADAIAMAAHFVAEIRRILSPISNSP